jgi:hypothetical protein
LAPSDCADSIALHPGAANAVGRQCTGSSHLSDRLDNFVKQIGRFFA